MIQLIYPVTTKELNVTEIQVRRLKGRDMKLLENAESLSTQRVVQMLHKLCDQPKHVIDDLDFVDIQRAEQVVGAFLLPGPGAGAK